MPAPLHLRFRRPLLLLAALCLPGVHPSASRAAATPPALREISEKTSAQLGRLRTLADAKDYPAALALLDPLLAAAPADSYDLVVLGQIKGQIHLLRNEYAASLPPLTQALQIGEAHGWLDAQARLDLLYLLAQIHSQLAADAPAPAPQRAEFAAADAHLRRWLALAPKSSAEIQLFSASLLYNQATEGAGAPDTSKLREALAAAETGLRLTLNPPEQLYALILAALQQLGETARSADLLELLVQAHPDNRGHWQQLAATYLGLAADPKDPREAGRWQLRAILTYERARERGFLNAPSDTLNLAGLYGNAQQFDRTGALLETGLHDGSVPNVKRNWEALASTWQQAHQDSRAVATLLQAAALFPQEGSLEYDLGQLCYGLGRTADARTHLEAAIAKGRLEQPGQTCLFLAHLCYELRQFDDAAQWVQKAAALPDTKPEEAERLARAINDARQSRTRQAQPPG